MRGKSFVGLRDQLFIKPALARSRLVVCNQENTLSTRIKSKCYSPYATLGIESQFLHVGMLRSLERVHVGASESGAIFGKSPGGYKQFVLNLLLESQELSFKFIFKTNGPRHAYSSTPIYLSSYPMSIIVQRREPPWR